MNTSILPLLLFVQIYFFIAYSSDDYKIVVQRMKVVSVNHETMDAEVFVSRIDRYTVALNLFVQLKRNIPPHYKIIVQCYEFLNNEYRPFAIHMEKSVCSLIETEYKFFLYPDFVRIGANMPKPKCPIVKGNYSFYNYTSTAAYFPPGLPFKNSLVKLIMMNNTVVDFHLDVYVKLDRDVVIRERYS